MHAIRRARDVAAQRLVAGDPVESAMREATPSLTKMRDMCPSTVFSLRKSRVAISRLVTWLALHDREYAPVQRSGLIELGPTELAEQLDWP
jgi:hypothetical protein